MTLAIWVGAVFLAGVIAVLLRLPPLVGFLAAGFVLNGVGVEELSSLDFVADVGVTLLLFSIGLKLDLRQLVRREVLFTAVAHMVVVVVVAMALLRGLGLLGASLLAGESWETLAMLAFALSFSSTVFVIKVLNDRSETQALYGRIAIAILILQDLAAVVFIVMSSDDLPSPWTPVLLLFLAAGRPVRAIWNRLGHGEMQTIFGLFMALVPGYALFDYLGIKGDLGALAMGVLLAGGSGASELSRALMSIKDLLLVGFFVSIGFSGPLSWDAVGLGLVLLLLVPVQAFVYMVLLRRSRLRRRTAVLTGLALAQHSEFALIVVAFGISGGLLDEEWLVVASVAVAASFLLSTFLNSRTSALIPWLTRRLPLLEPTDLHPEDRYVDLSDVEALVLGMGRVGAAAHRSLRDDHGLQVLGVELDPARATRMYKAGMRVIVADAEDNEFWERVAQVHTIQVAILAMPFHGSNAIALQRLQDAGFRGKVVAVAQYDDDARSLLANGADDVLQIYDGAGTEMADRAMHDLRR
jgi:glutathione-regulated potassium-efflux system ancillary protein KefC